jgi:hypothetical protein
MLLGGRLGFEAQAQEPARQERLFHLLYVGDPQSSRAEDFRSFLESKGMQVQAVSYDDLLGHDFSGVDLVLADAFPGKDFNEQSRARMGFARQVTRDTPSLIPSPIPVMGIGVSGGYFLAWQREDFGLG